MMKQFEVLSFHKAVMKVIILTNSCKIFANYHNKYLLLVMQVITLIFTVSDASYHN